MLIADVENAVKNLDDRVAIKSVYNRLRHLERTTGQYQRIKNRWYRREDLPPPYVRNHAPLADLAPEKERPASGVEPVRPDWTSARAPVATGEVGGG